jgi:hypothetical protein
MFLDLATYASLIWLAVVHAVDAITAKACFLVASVFGQRSKLSRGEAVQTEYSASDEVCVQHSAYLRYIISAINALSHIRVGHAISAHVAS